MTGTRGTLATTLYRFRGEPGDAQLTLLGGFRLICGGRLVTPSIPAQRLLAFLALHDRPVSRVYVAGTLWLESSEQRAAGNLRSAICRLRGVEGNLIDIQNGRLGLGAGVQVDVHLMVRHSRELLDASLAAVEDQVDRDEFCHDLLPDWYEDWVDIEREQLRQLRLCALEALAERYLKAGHYAAAVEAGLAAVRCEVLRESAHRVLIRAHLANGNTAEALRQYRLYSRILASELRLEPSAHMRRLIAPFIGGRGRI